jgi:hypothetical protein
MQCQMRVIRVVAGRANLLSACSENGIAKTHRRSQGFLSGLTVHVIDERWGAVAGRAKIT